MKYGGGGVGLMGELCDGLASHPGGSRNIPLWKQNKRDKLSGFLNSSTDFINPTTPISDKDRISSYNINTIRSRQVTRIKKNIH